MLAKTPILEFWKLVLKWPLSPLPPLKKVIPLPMEHRFLKELNIVVWRGLADVVEKYVHKGDKLYLEGKIRTRSYDDSRGIKRYITELFVDNMEMLSVKPQQAPPPPPLPEHTNNQTRSAVNECPPPPPPTKDDLPF